MINFGPPATKYCSLRVNYTLHTTSAIGGDLLWYRHDVRQYLTSSRGCTYLRQIEFISLQLTFAGGFHATHPEQLKLGPSGEGYGYNVLVPSRLSQQVGGVEEGIVTRAKRQSASHELRKLCVTCCHCATIKSTGGARRGFHRSSASFVLREQLLARAN